MYATNILVWSFLVLGETKIGITVYALILAKIQVIGHEFG